MVRHSVGAKRVQSAKSLAEGMVDFPGVANRPLVVRLRLAAPRPAGEPVVTGHGQWPRDRIVPGRGGFTEQAFIAGREAVGWDGDVIVSIRVPPFTVPPDTRQLGAAVAWVEIAPAGGPAIPLGPALVQVLLPLLLATVGLFWLARRFRWSAPAAAGLAVGLAALGALWIGLMRRPLPAGRGWSPWRSGLAAVVLVYGPAAWRRLQPGCARFARDIPSASG